MPRDLPVGRPALQWAGWSVEVLHLRSEKIFGRNTLQHAATHCNTVQRFGRFGSGVAVPLRSGLPRIGSAQAGRVRLQNRTFPDDLGGGCEIWSLISNDLRQGVSDARPVLVLRTSARSTKPANESNASRCDIRFSGCCGFTIYYYIFNILYSIYTVKVKNQERDQAVVRRLGSPPNSQRKARILRIQHNPPKSDCKWTLIINFLLF